MVEITRRHAAETGSAGAGVMTGSPVHESGAEPVSEVRDVTLVTHPGITLQPDHLQTTTAVN